MRNKILSLLVLLITAVGGAWAQSTFSVVEFDVPADWENNENYVKAGDLTGFKAVTLDEAKAWTGAPKTGNAILVYAFDFDFICYVPFSNGTAGEGNSAPFQKKDVFDKKSNTKFFITTEPSVDVTLNEAKTEASFDMPTSDVDVNYELVRDMSVQMQAKVGDDPDKQPRYRVQWNGESWIPADLQPADIPGLFSVYDLIEKAKLDPENYLVSIYAIDAEGNPTGNAMNFETFTFAPGRYCVTASAQLDAPYEGTTAPSNIFELFQGYEIKVAAGEYATFYKDENLYTEDKDAVLYTIANVTDTEAQLSDAVEIMPKNTPMLVYNKSEQDKTFLLIPTTDDAPEVTPAEEFKGSLTEGEIPASSAETDYYALNGKAFVWVKYAIEIGANKCWLQIGDQPAAARAMTRSIVGGGNTTNMDDVRWQMEDGNYYDLQGRKVEKPNRKGIYIHNGQKVIVR